jgi:SET domain-containing protein
MALFEDGSKDFHHFPTLPAFVCPVEIRETPQYGPGHKGVFALESIPKGTKFWIWTERVKAIHHCDLESYIAREFGDDTNAIQVFLRQGFVLPPSKDDKETSSGTGKEDDYFYSNPNDAGRFMNHSNDPNCGPDGTLRDISPGEEMTMDYSFHGNPDWYQSICVRYNVETEAQVAEKARKHQQE